MSEQQQLTEEQFNKEMERITKLVRASKGLPPEVQDAINNLINMKSMRERSRFPTYSILSETVYLELAAKHYGTPAQILSDWAHIKQEALIEYKGQGRDEYVDAVKHSEMPDQTNFALGISRQQQRPQPTKRRWPWSRKPKEESEFAEDH